MYFSLKSKMTKFNTTEGQVLNQKNNWFLPAEHTLVVAEEISRPPYNVKRFEHVEKRYVNLRNYYYYSSSK